MPKVGMSSVAMVQAPWIDVLKFAAQNDFNAFELCCIYPFVDLDNTSSDRIAEANDIITNRGLEVCLHAPFLEINIAAFCPGIREESVRTVKKSIDLGGRLGAKTIVVHSGDFTFDIMPKNNKTNDNAITKAQWNYAIDSLRSINDYANSKGITICLENLAFYTHSIDRCFEDLLEIRESVGSSLKFTLDMGHARIAGGAKKGIRLLGDNIGHIHLTDNRGRKDDHLAVGDGNYDYSPFIDFLRNFSHVITLEVVDIGTDPGPVIRAKKALNRLLSP